MLPVGQPTERNGMSCGCFILECLVTLHSVSDKCCVGMKDQVYEAKIIDTSISFIAKFLSMHIVSFLNFRMLGFFC